MTKILLVHLPFCTTASPPYALTYIYAFLKENLKDNLKNISDKNAQSVLEVLDLNLLFHKLHPKIGYEKFKREIKGISSIKAEADRERYVNACKQYDLVTKDIYSLNNKLIYQGKKPELFGELMDAITSRKPEIVCFSIVYSSQAFYCYALINELNKLGIKTVIGGPAVNPKLKDAATKMLSNATELLQYIYSNLDRTEVIDIHNKTEINHTEIKYNTVIDFSIYDLEEYATPEIVLPLKTSNSCFYQKCSFCSHHKGEKYSEINLKNVVESIKKSGKKNIFLLDEMIYAKRLLDIANEFKAMKISWMCQLRPTNELTKEILMTLRKSGLKAILWGVECASDRILGLIQKGTNKNDIQKVLKDSHDAGIVNVVYMLYGFPTETKEEFLETIQFLKENSEYIDLVSNSVFGLQKDTPIYKNPEKYGITNVVEEERTILEPKISYETASGLTRDEARLLRKKYKKTFENLDKFPKQMNFFREHMLCLVD